MTHRSPATDTLAELTPYDTGDRLEPHPWPRNTPEDYGKVDFDDEEGATALTLHVDRNKDASGGYTLHIENVSVGLTVEGDETAPMIEAPSKELQEQVQHIIAGLRTPIEQEEAEVFWNYRQAVIIVPGEQHLREQQVIMVTEGGGVLSAKVGDWRNGVRDTRID
ncbi:hypothetical protein ACVWY0_001286 [Arthrobacter sp. UYNi723]